MAHDTLLSLQVVAQKYRGFDIPKEMTAIWKYLNIAYTREEFTNTCPGDKEIEIAYGDVAKRLVKWACVSWPPSSLPPSLPPPLRRPVPTILFTLPCTSVSPPQRDWCAHSRERTKTLDFSSSFIANAWTPSSLYLRLSAFPSDFDDLFIRYSNGQSCSNVFHRKWAAQLCISAYRCREPHHTRSLISDLQDDLLSALTGESSQAVVDFLFV